MFLKVVGYNPFTYEYSLIFIVKNYYKHIPKKTEKSTQVFYTHLRKKITEFLQKNVQYYLYKFNVVIGKKGDSGKNVISLSAF